MSKTKPKPSGNTPMLVSRRAASQQIVSVANTIHRDIIKKNTQPKMRFPIRSLSNVKNDPRKGQFEMLNKTATRTLS